MSPTFYILTSVESLGLSFWGTISYSNICGKSRKHSKNTKNSNYYDHGCLKT